MPGMLRPASQAVRQRRRGLQGLRLLPHGLTIIRLLRLRQVRLGDIGHIQGIHRYQLEQYRLEQFRLEQCVVIGCVLGSVIGERRGLDLLIRLACGRRGAANHAAPYRPDMTSARLFIHRFRRPLAAVSAALAALIAFTAARPGPPAEVDVLVAAVDLPAGAQLTVDDLDLRSIPVDYAAPGALQDIDEAVGRMTATSMASGEVLTPGRLVATGTRADGLHLVPVRLADPEAADLLAPGIIVDLVELGDGRADRVLAEGVQVVTVPRPVTATGLGSGGRRAGSLIVVAADRRTAVTLAAVGAQPGLGVVMR